MFAFPAAPTPTVLRLLKQVSLLWSFMTMVGLKHKDHYIKFSKTKVRVDLKNKFAKFV